MGKKVHASLFSGFGAADLAATWMGWDNAFWCEIDDFPRKVLGYWFPESIGYGNIKETDFTEWKGKIDVLTGGFPCQPFSVAGRRKGKEDDRYLWPEMLRAIREIRPTWIVGENVAGILSMVQPGREAEVEHQAALFEATDKETILEQEYVVETICRDIEQEGYTIQPIVIPACAVGAPHRRDRVFFVAYRADTGPKNMQCERKNRTDQPPDPSGTNSIRWVTGRANSEWKENHQKNRTHVQRQTLGFGDKSPASNSHNNGLHDTQDRQGNRERNNCHPTWKNAIKQPARCGHKTAVTNSLRTGSEQIQQEIQSEQPEWISVDGTGDEWDVTNAMREEKLSSKFPNRYYKRTWQNFPTQPPVCRRDDGLPFDVERLTISIPKWREGSIKGYGNAIVPQVMYEIFKAIENP